MDHSSCDQLKFRCGCFNSCEKQKNVHRCDKHKWINSQTDHLIQYECGCVILFFVNPTIWSADDSFYRIELMCKQHHERYEFLYNPNYLPLATENKVIKEVETGSISFNSNQYAACKAIIQPVPIKPAWIWDDALGSFVRAPGMP